MSRRAHDRSRLTAMVATVFYFTIGCLTVSLRAAESERTRPNILWVTAEDISLNLGCYGDAYARTPELDAFARDGVRYTCAFATA